MMGFALDDNGDVLIENNEISIITGDSLLQQKVMSVLRTNLGEWFFDLDEGVDFDNLLGKNTNAELVRFEVARALAQVDSTFVITEFTYDVDKVTRKAKAAFKAQTESGEAVGGEYTWD